MLRQTVILASLAWLLVAAVASAATRPRSIPWQETGPFRHVDGSGTHRDSHTGLLHARAARLAPRPDAPESRDVGDVAVIVDDGTLTVPPLPPNPFDLAAGLTFVPAPDGFIVSPSAGGIVPDPGGVGLGLGDDDAAPVEAVDGGTFAGFPFLGATYGTDEIFVGSDGHVTFGAPDAARAPRDAARHVGGPPRVSALLADLDPSSGGDVRAEVHLSHVVVTWEGVPRFGLADSNTFQVVLRSDGTIELRYGAVASEIGVVGVAEGHDSGPFSEVEHAVDLPATLPAGAIFEEFTRGGQGFEIDVFGVAQRFLELHPDRFDFIVIFADFPVEIGFDAFAFHRPVKNDTEGLGLFFSGSSSVFDGTEAVENARTGPVEELESIVNMNRIGLYWSTAENLVDPPIKKFRFSPGSPGATLDGPPGSDQISRRARWFGTSLGDDGGYGAFTLGLNSAMSLMAHEAGHRWLAYPVFLDPVTFFGTDLLGRDFFHWSFFHDVRVPESQFDGDPRASSMEGNAILDLGPEASAGRPVPCTRPGESTFVTEPDELIDGYTELDQYFMGLRTADEVSPFWYVDEPRSATSGAPIGGIAGVAAQDDVLFCGQRVDLTLSDVTAAGAFFGPGNGPRIPALGDEVDTCGVDVKTMAFVLLVPGDPSQHAEAIQQVDTFRATWESYANGPATAGRGRFDSSLDPACH